MFQRPLETKQQCLYPHQGGRVRLQQEGLQGDRPNKSLEARRAADDRRDREQVTRLGCLYGIPCLEGRGEESGVNGDEGSVAEERGRVGGCCCVTISE